MYVAPQQQMMSGFFQPANVAQMGMMQQPVALPNLPLPANQFVTPPQQPNIANPIFQQQLTNDQGIARYSQMISWALANEVVSRAVSGANNNAIRIFGYNLYSQNQFNNNEFLELARLVAERVRLSVIRGEYQSVEQAIQVLVPDTYTLACGANMRRYEGLAAYVTSQVANDCMGAAQAIDRIYNDITSANNFSHQAQIPGAVGMQNNMQPQQQSGGFTNFNQPVSSQQPVNAAVAMINNKPAVEMTAMEKQLLMITNQTTNNQPTHQTQNVTPNKSSPLSGSYRANPTMHNPNAQTQEQSNVQPTSMHFGANAPEYHHVDQNEFDRQVEQARNASTVDVQTTITGNVKHFNRDEIIVSPEDINDLKVTVTENAGAGQKFHFVIAGKRYDIESPYVFGEVEWAPSALQPYHPLVCLSYQRVSYVKLKDQTVVAIVQELPEGEWHMDYDKHAVNGKFNSKPPMVPYAHKPMEKPTFTDVAPTGMIIARTEAYSYSSIEQAIHESYMSSYYELHADKGKNAMIIESCVLTPIILRSAKLANKILDELKNALGANSFANVAGYISNIKDINLREQINQFVTDRVNTVVRFELSMAGNPITNFIEDHEDLLSVIKTHYAGAIAETIVSYQSRIIRSAFDVVPAEQIDSAYEFFTVKKDDAEDILKRTLFITRDITVATVNFYSEDLSAFLVKESCAVLENMHPQLREIIEQCLTSSGPVKTNGNHWTHSSYLVTLDGCKFEVARSMTQNSAFLIRRA